MATVKATAKAPMIEREPGPAAARPANWLDQPGGREALERLRGFGGERLLRDMAHIFVTDMPARVALAQSALLSGDAGAVAYAAHTMKSSGAQFGAAALERLCADAERAARAGDLAVLPALVAGIERELAGYCAWLALEVPLRSGQPGQPERPEDA